MSIDKANLAKSWIQLQGVSQESEQAQELMWAAVRLNRLALSAPSECWDIVLDIINQTNDDWVLTNVAAGPLENLMALHSDEVINWIEKEARSNSKLKKLLSGVWKNLIPSDAWVRLQNIK